MHTFAGSWIWTSEPAAPRNVFARFRRTFSYSGGKADLHITADSRYFLYVNGERIGFGPVRAWPGHWRYDTYDLAPYLKPGKNVVAALVNHYVEGNFQYLPAPPGLLADVELDGEVICTDEKWRVSIDPAMKSIAPRISVQQAYEEQFDARAADGWVEPCYDDSPWKSAVALRPADDGIHQDMQHRGIPFLTLEPILPQRVVSVETVQSVPHRFTIYPKPYLTPGDLSSNGGQVHAYLATQVWAESACEVKFLLPHKTPGEIKVNGLKAEGAKAALREGWNSLVVSIRGDYHLIEFVVCVDGPAGLRFSSTGEKPGAPWAVVGPFGLRNERIVRPQHVHMHWVIADPPEADRAVEVGEAFWESCDVASAVSKPYFQQIRPEDLPEVDAFVQAYTDKVIGACAVVQGVDGLVSGSDWTTVNPDPSGNDVRILLDYGREIVGFQAFEIEAPAGTIVDFHNFEFVQPDGRYCLAEWVNDSFRYVCRDGRQSYQTLVRRGYQYSYLVLRNVTGPVRLNRVHSLFSSYPQARQGNFACSDAQLDRIWQVGAHTLRCCAEDTYTDCPTYEQTHWVGDARNEALVDWIVNGDPRLWFRCLEQTGGSLDRSEMTESHVPSAWQNIIPAWSFFWMRSCREYLLFTGDFERAGRLLEFVERNVEGMVGHLNADGLFEIDAWNMFDWAEMDTPNSGVVTHQNCLAVHALRDAAEMAEWLGREDLAVSWLKIADDLAAAINRDLWNEEKQAFTDCLRDGGHSKVFSQQTQTAAYISGAASGERLARCRDIMYNPPEGFVKAGSPFFEFFLLEGMQREGREQDFIDTILKDWGFMVDIGASTFWEMWSVRSMEEGRLTRSHCHGWSAAPTFFLSTYVLGLEPGKPGSRSVTIEPHPGDLAWARGRVPTASGVVEVQWENPGYGAFELRVKAPADLKLDIRLPRPGKVTVNGAQVEAFTVR